MPKSNRTHKKKYKYPEELMKNAVDHVINKKFLLRQVAADFHIPRATLQRHVQLAKLAKPSCFLQPPEEGTLQEIVMNLCITFYWITATKLKQLMFEYEMAKLTDFQTFIKSHICFARFICHQYFYNRTLQGVTTNYTLSETKAFFDDFAGGISKLNIVPSNIYDVDEISIGVDKTMSKSIICVNGKNYYVDENSPQLVVVNSMNAEGRYMPPFFVAKKNEIRKFIKDLKPGMVACETRSNRLTAEIFIEWLHHFKDFAKPSAHGPVLLIVDNSMWHVSITAYQYCQKHFINLHVLPPHTAKRMHPLEQSLYKLLRKACQEEAGNYLLNNPDKVITIRDLVRFYVTSFYGANEAPRCAYVGAKGFVTCGIYPPNPLQFRMTFNQITKPLEESDPSHEEEFLNIYGKQAGVLKFDYENSGMRDKGAAVFVKPEFIQFSSGSNRNVATTISQLLFSTVRGLPVSTLNQPVSSPVTSKKRVPIIFSKYIRNIETSKSKSAVNVKQKISGFSVSAMTSTGNNHSDEQASSHNLETSRQFHDYKIKILKTPDEAYSKPDSQPDAATSKSRLPTCSNHTSTDSIQIMFSKGVQTDPLQFKSNVLPSISISPEIEINRSESSGNEFVEVLNFKVEKKSVADLHEEVDLPVDIIKTEEVG